MINGKIIVHEGVKYLELEFEGQKFYYPLEPVKPGLYELQEAQPIINGVIVDLVIIAEGEIYAYAEATFADEEIQDFESGFDEE